MTEAPDNTEYIEPEEEKSFFEDKRKVTFYLVVPLFVACYSGSCIIYAIGKCWR